MYPEHHGDHQVRVVGRRYFGRRRGGQPGAAGLNLQRVRDVHEQPLGTEDGRGGQRDLQRHPEAVEAGIGAGEAVNPPVHAGFTRAPVTEALRCGAWTSSKRSAQWTGDRGER